MNFILYVHDYGDDPVWPYGPGVVEQVERELGTLIGDYTMGRVTVDLVPESARLRELEEMYEEDHDHTEDDPDA